MFTVRFATPQRESQSVPMVSSVTRGREIQSREITQIRELGDGQIWHPPVSGRASYAAPGGLESVGFVVRSCAVDGRGRAVYLKTDLTQTT